MAERPIASVLKTEGSKGSVGSNPTTSAKFCLCVYGYPYVIREPTKPFVYVLDARSRSVLIDPAHNLEIVWR